MDKKTIITAITLTICIPMGFFLVMFALVMGIELGSLVFK